MSSHLPTCHRGWYSFPCADCGAPEEAHASVDHDYDAMARWHHGQAPPHQPQWHSANCESYADNLRYAVEHALYNAPVGAVPYPEDTIPLNIKAARYGVAMAAFIQGARK